MASKPSWRRAKTAFEANGHTVRQLPTETAFLGLAGLPRLASSLIAYVATPSRTYDVAWLQYGNFFDLVYLIPARLSGRPLYVTPHIGTHWRSQASPALRSAGTRLLGLARGIVTLSRNQEEELPLPKGVPVARIATFLPRFVPLRSNWSDIGLSPIVILHAGRLSDDKGTFRFLDTLRDLRKRGVSFEARIAGRADEAVEARLRREIEGDDLRGYVRYLGSLDQDSLLAQLSECDALVHLSVSDSYPLILLEAIGSGVVPIAVDLPGARGIADEFGGYAVPLAGCAEAAAGILAQAALDPHFQPESRQAAAMQVRTTFAWPACVERAVDAFRALAR